MYYSDELGLWMPCVIDRNWHQVEDAAEAVMNRQPNVYFRKWVETRGALDSGKTEAEMLAMWNQAVDKEYARQNRMELERRTAEQARPRPWWQRWLLRPKPPLPVPISRVGVAMDLLREERQRNGLFAPRNELLN